MPVSLLQSKNIRKLSIRIDPQVLAEVAQAYPQAFFLDSADLSHPAARYSYFGIEPFAVFKSLKGVNSFTTHFDQRQRILPGDPLTALDTALEPFKRPRPYQNSVETGQEPDHLDGTNLHTYFNGGAVGYLSYDLGRSIERVPEIARDEPELPEIYVGLYDPVICFDVRSGEAYLLHDPELPGVLTPEELIKAVTDSERKHPSADGLLKRTWTTGDTANARPELRSELDRSAYTSLVERAKQFIAKGDIYQVNLSHRFETRTDLSDAQLHNALREHNPAPFSAYLKFPELSVLSSSPERFIASDALTIETCPIKGTRPRGLGPEADQEQAEVLLASEKDRAEHVMIVDLERNDLGRICRTGSVTVRNLMRLESFASVHHLVSLITGELKDGLSYSDILKATFPGGSITGAPKIRSMEIIEELEPIRRGVYTGAIGYLGNDGQFDLSIAIRTLVKQGQRVIFSVGGGIVADSVPDREYEETLHKAEGIVRALNDPDALGRSRTSRTRNDR